MTNSREIKNLLYEQVARISKAASSPKRLELIEVLCQGEKCVDQLAKDTDLSIKLTSAHLKQLKASRLLESRRDGKNIYYKLADTRVADLWIMLRELAEERLLELQSAMQELVTRSDELSPIGGAELQTQAQHGELVVIDVRPETEYSVAHLPFARSIPLSELKHRLNELPVDKAIVAYCRGPFCLMAKDAVDMLRQQGIKASRLETGVAEWRLSGLPLIEN